MLADGEKTTGAQVVIAVFPSLEGESLEDFSIKVAEKWRVGQKGLDDGAILLVFLKERKVRIEVGYGLEGAIPDIEAARIIRETIAPHFREGHYDLGLEAAARAIYARVESKAPAERRGTSRGGATKFPIVGVVGFFAILAIIAVMLLREAATRRGLTGGGYTAGGGGWGVLPFIIGSLLGEGGRGAAAAAGAAASAAFPAAAARSGAAARAETGDGASAVGAKGLQRGRSR